MQPTTQDIAAVAEAYFHSMEGPCRHSRLVAGVHIAAFEIADVGVWFITYKDGRCLAGRYAAPPDVIYTLSPEVFLRIVDKTDPLNPASAFLKGQVAVDGDLSLAWVMLNENIKER